MDWAESYQDILQAMRDDRSGYFEERHFNKVHHVHERYQQKDPSFYYSLNERRLGKRQKAR